MSVEEIKKALEGVTPGPWHVYSEKVADKAAAIAESAYQVEHTDPFVGEIFMLNGGGKCPAITGCGPCSKANARYIAAVNPAVVSELLSTLESLQRENEELRQRLDIGPCGEDAIDVAESAADHLRHRAEAAEAEVKRLQAEIDRKSSMPGDHRYWEGRYRDEAAENEKLREALTPFVLAFESRRETYSKRYRSNRQLGYANFDKMPDDWAMEKVAFNMGTYRCAHKALSSAGRDPLKAFDTLVEGPSFTEIASTGGEHHAE